MAKILLIGGEAIAAGLPKHLCHLAQALSPDFEVEILTEPDRGGFASLDKDQTRLISCPHLSTRLSPAHLWRAARALLHHLGRSDADLIWIHARLPLLLVRLLMLCRIWNPQVPICATFHGLPFDPGHRIFYRSVSRVLEWLLLTGCPPLHLIFLTDEMAMRFSDALGPMAMGRHQIHILENCADLGPMPARQSIGPPHLLVIGRDAYQKNLARAARLMAQMPDGTRLTFCGPGTDDPAFCDRIAAEVPSNALANTRFIGPVTDVRPLLAEADALLLPSRYEGTPLVALEACEAGLPVIMASFQGARTLAQGHPYALILRHEPAKGEGERIRSLIDRFRANRPIARQEIRARWASRWSRRQFDPAVRVLVAKMLARNRIRRLAAE